MLQLTKLIITQNTGEVMYQLNETFLKLYDVEIYLNHLAPNVYKMCTVLSKIIYFIATLLTLFPDECHKMFIVVSTEITLNRIKIIAHHL